uniref:Uncharacterized protein n=1 Tax=Solanum lycopersicum TaxID=4081 RepID=A0A3Q7FIY8_SOLLC
MEQGNTNYLLRFEICLNNILYTWTSNFGWTTFEREKPSQASFINYSSSLVKTECFISVQVSTTIASIHHASVSLFLLFHNCNWTLAWDRTNS